MESWRLRELAGQPGCPVQVRDALREAADDLARLRARLAQLVEAEETAHLRAALGDGEGAT